MDWFHQSPKSCSVSRLVFTVGFLYLLQLNITPCPTQFDPLPDDKILDLTELKAFADNKLYNAKIISVIDRMENIVENKKMLVPLSVFFVFHNVFQQPSLSAHAW